MSAVMAPREDRNIEHLRLPPHSVDAEQAVLGGLMIRPEAWDDVADLLEPEDFYRRDHQLIFQAISEAAEGNKPFDAVTLGEWFESKGEGEAVAGSEYLIELCRGTWTAANIRAHAQIVADKSTLRALIETGSEIVNDGFQPEGRATADIVANAAAKTAALTLRGARDGGLMMVRSGLADVRHEIESRYHGTIDVGLTPPWGNVRDILPGLEDTDFMVIAGRQAWASGRRMEFADHAAELGRNVAVFSLEMSRQQLTLRMISRRARIDQTRMRVKGALDDADWAAITQAQSALFSMPPGN